MLGSSSSKFSESSNKDLSQERKPAKKRVLMVKILNDKHGILETLLSESVKELPQPI